MEKTIEEIKHLVHGMETKVINSLYDQRDDEV